MDEQLKIPGAITVAELIAQLQELDPQASVVIAYPSGDYWRTTLARAVRSDQVNDGLVEWRSYHDSWAISTDKPDCPRHAVIIGAAPQEEEE